MSLRKLALAALTHPDGDEWHKVSWLYASFEWADAQFIAACSPPEILKLLDRVDELEGVLDFYANHSRWAHHPEFENACCLDNDDYGEKARKVLCRAAVGDDNPQ